MLHLSNTSILAIDIQSETQCRIYFLDLVTYENCPHIKSWSSSLSYRDKNYPDYRFGLITKSRLLIRIHDGLKINQDLAYSFAIQNQE